MILGRKALVLIVTLLVTANLSALFTACKDTDQTVVGSGNLITQEMDFTDFTKVEISHVFQAKVIRADSFSISITIDDNLPEYVAVRKSGNTLRIYLEGGYTYIGTTKMVEITMPKIDKLSLSGASQAEVSGFRSSDRLSFEASGVSSLNIDDLKAGDTSFKISGGSHVSGGIEIASGKFDVSGTSVIDLEGFASDISVEASGGSKANLGDLSASNAIVKISEASTVTVNASSTVDGDVSGASRLIYIGNPMLTIEMSGDSTVDNK